MLLATYFRKRLEENKVYQDPLRMREKHTLCRNRILIIRRILREREIPISINLRIHTIHVERLDIGLMNVEVRKENPRRTTRMAKLIKLKYWKPSTHQKILRNLLSSSILILEQVNTYRQIENYFMI